MKILLKEIMDAEELSIRQVSIACKVSITTVYRIANGACPKMHTMEKLAKGLRVGIIDLFESEYKFK